MTTKLYFHAAANALSGTFPTGEQSPNTPGWSATGASTLRTMNTTIGVAQTSLAGSTLASTSGQLGFLGFFCSPALSGAQTIGTGNFTINVADSESNLNANFLINHAYIYVWRPGTGVVYQDIWSAGTLSGGGLEPTAASSEQVTAQVGITGVAVAASDGDVIICELWGSFTQAMATSYTATLFYDGTTENTTENAVVSNHAAFIQFTETLTFQGGLTTGVGASSGTGAATGVGASAANSPGSSAGVGAATGVGRSTAASVGSGSGTGAATGIGASAANSVGASAGTGTALGVAAVASNVGSASGTSTASAVGAAVVAAVGSAAGTSTVTAIGTSTGGATIEYLGGMPDRYAYLDYSRRAHREVQETKRLSKTQAKKRIKEAYRLVSIRAMPDSELVEALRPYSPRAAAALLPPAESVAFSKLVDDTEALRLIYLAYYEALDEEEAEILLLAS